jgi:hypothetical protein
MSGADRCWPGRLHRLARVAGSLERGRALVEPAAVEDALRVGVREVREAVRAHAARPVNLRSDLLGGERPRNTVHKGGPQGRQTLLGGSRPGWRR